MKSSKLVALIGAIGVCFAAGAVSAETKMSRGIEAKRLEAERVAANQAAFDAALPARLDLVQSVINQYAPEILADREFGTTRMAHFAQHVHSTPSAVLTSARVARTVSEFGATAERVAAITPKAFGDNFNLVFVPVTPCRIADSRLSTGGALVNNVSRQYLNYAAAGQGGTSGCNNTAGIPGIFAGSPGAVALNLTVTGATHQGFLAVRPSGSTNVTSAINFLANQDIANAIVVRMTGLGGNDFEARPTLNGPGTAALHVIFDLLGFYVANLPTPLECVDTAAVNDTTGTNPANETSLFVNACAAGYTRVGMSCEEGIDAILTDFSVVSGYCSFIPRVATATPVSASSRCCRLPGNAGLRFN